MKTNVYNKGKFTVYDVIFSDLTDLYNYLKSNPKVNKKIFPRNIRASIKNDSTLGFDLDKAIEYIPGGYEENIKNFLTLKENMTGTSIETRESRDVTIGVYGGIPFVPNVVKGVSDCMISYDRNSEVKVRNIYFGLSYPIFSSDDMILNRGLIALYIIDALEKKGELINLKTFQASGNGNEIIRIEIGLKKSREMSIDPRKCYFPLARKEFFRRILFRVFESVDAKEPWGENGYGNTLSKDKLKDFFEIPDQDIVIPSPHEIGIKGNNIYDDTISAITALGLENEFDLNKIRNLKEKTKKKVL